MNIQKNVGKKALKLHQKYQRIMKTLAKDSERFDSDTDPIATSSFVGSTYALEAGDAVVSEAAWSDTELESAWALVAFRDHMRTILSDIDAILDPSQPKRRRKAKK